MSLIQVIDFYQLIELARALCHKLINVRNFKIQNGTLAQI